MSLFNSFVKSAVNQVGRDVGRNLSNNINNNRNSKYFVRPNIDKNLDPTDPKSGLIKENNEVSYNVIKAILIGFIPIYGFFYSLYNGIYYLTLVGVKYNRNEQEAVYKQDLRFKTGKRYIGHRTVNKSYILPLTNEDKIKHDKIGITLILLTILISIYNFIVFVFIF